MGDITDDEAVEIARNQGLAFALDHIGYDGLGNIAIELLRERDAYREEAVRWLQAEHLETGRGEPSSNEAGEWVDRAVRDFLDGRLSST